MGTSHAVDVETQSPLDGATFADAYQLDVNEPALDAITATKRVMSAKAGWIDGLMRLRNALVAPLGLKAAPDAALNESNSIGTFPLISSSPTRVVLGLDDKHLDFRIVVDALVVNGKTRITTTTFVKTQNFLGRTYLALVLPFHRIIVPKMLQQADRA